MGPVVLAMLQRLTGASLSKILAGRQVEAGSCFTLQFPAHEL